MVLLYGPILKLIKTVLISAHIFTNWFCFLNMIFNTVCHLQVIRLDLLCTDLTVVTTSASVRGPVMQLCNAEVQQLEKCRYIIWLFKLLHNQVVVPNSAALERLNRTLQCFLLQSWRASLCSERFVPYTKQ